MDRPVLKFFAPRGCGFSGVRITDGVLDCELSLVEGMFGRFCSSKALIEAASENLPEYVAICFSGGLKFVPGSLDRMVRIAEDSKADMLYSDYYDRSDGRMCKMPLADFQPGSVRDDFDFGKLAVFRSSSFRSALQGISEEYEYAALYALWLKISENGRIEHVREFMYSAKEEDKRKSGEKNFDYVSAKSRSVQIEMEKAFTGYLERIGAILRSAPRQIEYGPASAEGNEVSVIIPVYNRALTIEDALKSALSQRTDFRYNVIVVDNHSDDGTSEIVERYAMCGNVEHIVPVRTDLGIGGCWNEALNHPSCGRFAVQLDSDDVYSNDCVLQSIRDGFLKQKCALLVGTYMLTDYDMNRIEPGIIDHKEWTEINGRNNALRINGFGAPRAFYSPVAREIGFPNVSYGEDYAMCLRISREYKVGRIYDVLYFCRRWKDNSDADLDVTRINENNLYKDRLRTWEIEARKGMDGYGRQAVDNLRLAVGRMVSSQIQASEEVRSRYESLGTVSVKSFDIEGMNVKVQFNESRLVSSAAKVDAASVASRKCFLCKENRPSWQEGLKCAMPVRGLACPESKRSYTLLVNPFPIFRRHITIVSDSHVPQRIAGRYGDMLFFSMKLNDYAVFYNGPECGASAPDHMHFQACGKGELPVERDYAKVRKEFVCSHGMASVYRMRNFLSSAFIIESENADDAEALFGNACESARCVSGDNAGPKMNIISWHDGTRYVSVLVLRKKHRPDCYYAEGAANLLSSPASVDMGGVFIIPLKKDFDRITESMIRGILSEVLFSDEETDKIAGVLKSL